MSYSHYLHYVSQNLAEQAMSQIDELSFIKKLQVLNLPSSWTLQIQTDDQLHDRSCRLISRWLNPMTPIWNKPQMTPIVMTNFGTRENWHSSKGLDPGNDEHVHQGHHYGSRSRP